MDINGSFLVDDDFLDFLDEEEGEKKGHLSSSSSSCTISYHGDEHRNNLLSHELVEEELEWLSNKDAFPSVESCFDIPSVPEYDNNETEKDKGSNIMSLCTSLNIPVGKRSKRRKRDQNLWVDQVNVKKNKEVNSSIGSIGRKCLHCLSENTPLWRAGPMGPKTLCNACGVRYRSGRLVPEYRPASSPTFSAVMHSNSHRRVVEMRRRKQMPLEV